MSIPGSEKVRDGAREQELSDTWKGVSFWTNEIRKAGIYDQLPHFNDLLTGKEPPKGYGEPLIRDILLDGRKCDVYHTDKEERDSFHRVFVHIKE